MRPRRIINHGEARELIGAAVREHALAVLSMRRENDWVTYKAHFLERDPQERFFVLDHQETHGTQPPAIEVGGQVGISFRHKSRKVMFATVIEAIGRFVIDSDQSIPAVRYHWPDVMTELQRRAYHRTLVPASTIVRTVFWAGGVDSRIEQQSQSRAVWCGENIDLSCGGTLIRLGQTPEPHWTEGQLLGLEVHLPDGRPPLVVDAFFRGLRRDDEGDICVGTQFVGLEHSNSGRKALQRLARCVQNFNRMAMVGVASSKPRLELG